MRVATKAYGAIDVDERQKILFPYGILGFEKLRDFVLLDAAQAPFYWLQSLEVVEIAFVLISPRVFHAGYRLEVPREEIEEIGIDSPDKALDFAIVTVPDDPKQMSANLQGPIIINRDTRVGRQCISQNPDYGVRHPILEELALLRGQAC